MAGALCIGLVAGAIQAAIAAESFTLAWIHSIEKIRWEEDYMLLGKTMIATHARVQGSGPGMEPLPGSVFKNGWYEYRPDLPPLPRLTLSRRYVAGYELCWDGRCRKLGDLAPEMGDGTIEIFPCDRQPTTG